MNRAIVQAAFDDPLLYAIIVQYEAGRCTYVEALESAVLAMLQSKRVVANLHEEHMKRCPGPPLVLRP